MSVHVQTGNMLDVVVEDGRLWLYLRNEKQMFLLEKPEGLRDVLAAEIKRLNPAAISEDAAPKWSKELPTVNGYYWRRDYENDSDPELVEVVGKDVCYIGIEADALSLWSHCEWNGPLSPIAPATSPSTSGDAIKMGYARIAAANGEAHDVVFACAACGRKLIWTFEDWKCPCGNATFKIDTAIRSLPAIESTSVAIEDAAKEIAAWAFPFTDAKPNEITRYQAEARAIILRHLQPAAGETKDAE